MACLDPDKLTDLLVNLVLSFNLHFDHYNDNIIMAVLGEYGTAKTFTEKLIFLVNRGGKEELYLDIIPIQIVLFYVFSMFSARVI